LKPTSARLATKSDIGEVVRLGQLMFESMGVDSAGWIGHANEVLGRGCEDGRMAAFVVDHPEQPGRLISSGVGVLQERLPGPTAQVGRTGFVQYVWTDPDYRGNGLARSVMESLLAWFRESGVRIVELTATNMGEPLYRSMGFSEPVDTHLRLLLSGPA
jgi:GNAT superfamily N-acetyltransferase